jgi:transposase
VLRTGAPWRDPPPRYGGWNNTHRRFCQWRDAGEWEGLLEILVRDPDYERPVIDATRVKVHQDGTGAKGGSQDVGRTKGGSARRYT